MCGIFGALNSGKAAELVFCGLHGIQHRAKEFAGIVSSDGTNLYRKTGPGTVQDVFSDISDIEKLRGRSAIGHIRYSTIDDDPKLDNTQPIIGSFGSNEVALAVNGNIVNHKELKQDLSRFGPFKTSMDSEIILRLFCLSDKENIFERVFDSVKGVRGTYSMVFLWDDVMIAVRDPLGNKPLSIGKSGASWFVSSETTSFDSLDIETIRDVSPGEIALITKHGVESVYFDENRLSENPIPHKRAHCVFSLLYYALPASVVFGEFVAEYRKRCGRKLCEICPCCADTVVGVPDSALFHAEGYAEAKGLQSISAILRSHYVGRTFILPVQDLREAAVARKFAFLLPYLKGKDVVLVDDSIVRLTTLPKVVASVRRAGAKSVHARIAAPKIIYPCYYGIDTPVNTELSASTHTEEEIRKDARLDSLGYMTIEGLRSLVSNPDDYCYACMTGEYPI